MPRAAASYDLMKEKVQAELKQNFRPEFLNRIDATVVFRSLTVDEIAPDRGPHAQAGPRPAQGPGHDAQHHPGGQGAHHQAGLRRRRTAPARSAATIQNLIEDPLAEHLLLGRYNQGDTIVVDANPDGKGLSIEATEAKTPVEA